MMLLEEDLAEADRTPAAIAEDKGLPTLDERADMFLRAVYGPEARPTAEQRAAARERILAAMAVDLAEETTDPGPEANISPSPARNVAAQPARPASAGWAQLLNNMLEVGHKLLAPAGEILAMRAVRMAAVPLLALLVVGSIWTGTRLGDDTQTELGPSASPPGAARNASPTTRGLTSPAERDLQRDIAAAEAGRGPAHPDVASKMVDLAALYRAQGRYGEAERLYDRALTIQQKALGARHPDAIRTTRELAAVYRAEGRAREADDLLRRAGQQ